MSAADLVADLLAHCGLTKSALAAKAGISRSSLDEWLKGERQPSVGQLERLGDAVGLRLDLAWREVEADITVEDERPQPASPPFRELAR